MADDATAAATAVDDLAERLYAWSGGIFWRGETTWQDHYREKARQWFAYAALLDRLPEVSTRRTEWGVRDDATGNVGACSAHSRASTEEWLAELTEPSTLMRRERTTYRDHVTAWVAVAPAPAGVLCPCTRWDYARDPDAPSEHPWEPGEGKCPDTPPPFGAVTRPAGV